MERLCETRGREKGEDSEHKRGKIGGEASAYSKRKGEMENEMRCEEVDLKRKELEIESKELDIKRETEWHEEELRNVE